MSDHPDQEKHQRYMELLAEETHHPLSEVEPIYKEVLDQLNGEAVIPDFVPVFAWRRTRAMLQHR